MEMMMSDQKFTTGDRVKHAAKPEWGIGTVTRVENLPMNGQPHQRLLIRFPNAGTKTIVTGQSIELHRITESADPFGSPHEAPSLKAWEKLNGSDWLGPMAKKKIEEALITIPADVRDPFNSLSRRLSLMLGLYRFDRSGKGVIDWAVAQTGMDDPLAKFSRQELEQRFERWITERDNYLAKLLQEARAPGADAQVLNNAVKSAPPAAVNAVRKILNNPR